MNRLTCVLVSALAAALIALTTLIGIVVAQDSSGTVATQQTVACTGVSELEGRVSAVETATTGLVVSALVEQVDFDALTVRVASLENHDTGLTTLGVGESYTISGDGWYGATALPLRLVNGRYSVSFSYPNTDSRLNDPHVQFWYQTLGARRMIRLRVGELSGPVSISGQPKGNAHFHHVLGMTSLAVGGMASTSDATWTLTITRTK